MPNHEHAWHRPPVRTGRDCPPMRAGGARDDPGVSEGSGWERRRQVLLSEYERVALELFAARGFKAVTVDDIADAAGVSARTLFRYFPTKEEFLLAYPRRSMGVMVDIIAGLPPSPTPVATAWAALREYYFEGAAGVP